MTSPVATAPRSLHEYEVSGHLTSEVLALLARDSDGTMTLREIGAELGLPPGTVSRATTVLRMRGLVQTAPPRPSSSGRGGRPVQPIRVSDRQVLLGFSISDIAELSRDPDKHPGDDAFFSRVVGCVTTLTGQPIGQLVAERLTVAQLRDTTGRAVAAVIGKMAKGMLANLRRSDGLKRSIAGLGVALGGVIREGAALQSCNLAWHGSVPLEKALRESLTTGIVVVENDANAVLISHARHPGAPWAPVGNPQHPGEPAPGRAHDDGYRQSRDLVVVLVRPDGIGGGVLANGRRVTGHRGAAGELGHVKVKEAKSLTCRCGAVGCLEAFCAPNRLTERLIAATGTEIKNFAEASGMQAGEAGYIQAVRYFRDAGRVLGQQIAAAATWTDPSAILLFLPPPLMRPQSRTPGAAYWKALTSAVNGVYPEPPDLLIQSLDDADALAAHSAAIVAFNAVVDKIRAN